MECNKSTCLKGIKRFTWLSKRSRIFLTAFALIKDHHLSQTKI